LLLARAILRGGRILVMDEAGAALDSATEQQLRDVVNEEFRGATVLAIIHRTSKLHADYNRYFSQIDIEMALSAHKLKNFQNPGS
jgi:ABC-type multidrug transport system fused ATPase/permease subunit